MDTPVEKRCSKCGDVKPAESFAADPTHNDGLSIQCRECRKAAKAIRNPTIPEKKRCKACGDIKLASEFAKEKTNADGLRHTCKACKKSGITRVQRISEPYEPPTEKPCNKCGIVKPLDEFHRHSKSKDGHSNTCKVCAIDLTRQWYATYSDEFNEERRQDRLTNGDAIRAKEREEYKGPRGIKKRASVKRWQENHPEQNKAAHREWYQRNKDREDLRLDRHARSMIQRARKYGCRRIEYFTILEIAERDGWICHVCQGHVTRKDWSVDHIVPLAQGGPHLRANVALAHRRCNHRRWARLLPGQFPLFPKM